MSYFDTPDFLFKIVIIGNSAVGKSSLLRSMSDKYWEESFLPTIGVDFKVHSFDIDDKVVKLQIWDTAGQERFKSICRSYYKGAHGMIFVYDVTDRMSFKDIEHWMEDADKLAGPAVPRIIVGNKCDLDDQRRVTYEEGKKFAEEMGVRFVEASAKSSHNVMQVFTSLAKDMKDKVEKKASIVQEKKPIKKVDLGEGINTDDGRKRAACCYYM